MLSTLMEKNNAYSWHEASNIASRSTEYRRLTSTTLIEYSKRDYNSDMYLISICMTFVNRQVM